MKTKTLAGFQICISVPLMLKRGKVILTKELNPDRYNSCGPLKEDFQEPETIDEVLDRLSMSFFLSIKLLFLMSSEICKEYREFLILHQTSLKSSFSCKAL